MINFTLPSLGADMDQGKLVEWRIAPGDVVQRGQIVAVIETSKAAVEVEIWHSGTVHELLVEPGAMVPVGTTLATLLEQGEDAASAKPAPRLTGKVEASVVPEVVATAASKLMTAPAARRRVSPAARKHAEEAGLQIDMIVGTGPDGAVTLQDVEHAIAAVKQPVTLLSVPSPEPVSAVAAGAASEKQAEMRKAIAAAMSRSKREIPHYYLSETVPMKHAQQWLMAKNEKRPINERILMAALQIKVVATALKAFPDMNGFYRDGVYQTSAAIHIGVAISLRQGGLIAPAIRDVADKPLEQIMRDLMDLVKRTRAGILRSSEMSDATITVTNLGEQGVEVVQGVIYPPQVALVGFGRIAERPWVEHGGLYAMPLMTASLAADHRVSDGHRGGMFLAAIRDGLQRPEELL